jgi:hypothetical protein
VSAPRTSDDIDAETIALALGGKRSGKGWICCCPAHKDRNPSFSIDDGNNGSPVFKCHAGCTQEAVMDALADRGLWNEEGDRIPRATANVHTAAKSGKILDFNSAPQQRFKTSRAELKQEPEPEKAWGPWQEICTYNYIEADGTLLFQVVRKERFASDGTKEKTFPGRRPDGNGGWINDKGDRRVLYRLPELISYPHGSLFATEGEKDADRIASLGACATTGPGQVVRRGPLGHRRPRRVCS